MTIIYPLSLISRRMMTSAMNPNVEKKSIKQMIDAIIKDEVFIRKCFSCFFRGLKICMRDYLFHGSNYSQLQP